ncbi:MAG: pilin [Patescibacteria group bacterium]|nr:pilin [Patescibacteria group bacterium]
MTSGFKKKLFLIFLVIFIFLLGGGIFEKVWGETTTFKLEYPEFVDPQKTKSPSEFVNKFYLYALGISSALAIMMIVYGGVKYAVNPGNTANQSEARDIIKSAVFGIVLLAGAYLILKTINPSLVNLSSPPLKVLEPATSSTSTPNLPPTQKSPYFDSLDSSNDAVKIFQMMGVGVSSSGNCYNYSSNCTSFYKFPKGAACKLIEMKYGGASDIVVTAGTEPGHQTHGPFKGIVDLRTNIQNQNSSPGVTDSYILGKIGLTKEQLWQKVEEEKTRGSRTIFLRFRGSDNNEYAYEAGVAGDGSLKNFHWHVRLQVKNEANGENVANFSASPQEGQAFLEWSKCK